MSRKRKAVCIAEASFYLVIIALAFTTIIIPAATTFVRVSFGV